MARRGRGFAVLKQRADQRQRHACLGADAREDHAAARWTDLPLIDRTSAESRNWEPSFVRCNRCKCVNSYINAMLLNDFSIHFAYTFTYTKCHGV